MFEPTSGYSNYKLTCTDSETYISFGYNWACRAQSRAVSTRIFSFFFSILRFCKPDDHIWSCEWNKIVSAFWPIGRRCHFVFKFLLFFIVFMCFVSFVKLTYFDFRLELNMNCVVFTCIFQIHRKLNLLKCLLQFCCIPMRIHLF